MQEILEHMGMIHDPRNASYIKHKLSDILFIVMCGVLSGLDTRPPAKSKQKLIIANSRAQIEPKSKAFSAITIFFRKNSNYLAEFFRSIVFIFSYFILPLYHIFLISQKVYLNPSLDIIVKIKFSINKK